MNRQETETFQRERNLWRLGFAVLGAEVAWTLHFIAVYVTAPSLCDAGLQWVLHLMTGLAFLVAGAAVALAAYDWWEIRRMDESQLTVRDSRNRFLLSQGMFLGILMLFGIIGAEVTIIFGRCM